MKSLHQDLSDTQTPKSAVHNIAESDFLHPEKLELKGTKKCTDSSEL